MKLLLIGASAGSGEAVERILEAAGSAKVAIIVCIHMAPRLIEKFAAYLGAVTNQCVVVTYDRMRLEEGRVYLCHSAYRVVYERIDGVEMVVHLPSRGIYHPSIDALFASVAQNKECVTEVLGCLLSGIGRDGVGGLKMLTKKGARTYVTRQEDSAIYGMPKVAIEQHACFGALSLDGLIQSVRRFVHG